MKWFSRLFSSRQAAAATAAPSERAPIHFPFQVDMHSHLLPGIDDGVQSLAESLQLVQQMRTHGYRKAITTPHIMGDFYRNTPEGILGKLSELRAYLDEHQVEFSIEAAAEYYLDEWFMEKFHQGRLLTFGPRMVLVETSYINRPPNMQDVLFELKTSGYQPVLAHPERYTYLHGRMEEVGAWREAGILMQLNLASLSGYYGPQVKEAADFLVQRRWVDLVGTDVHGQRHWNACLRATRSRHYRMLEHNPIQNDRLLRVDSTASSMALNS